MLCLPSHAVWSSILGEAHEAARFHHTSSRRGCLIVRRSRAAVSEAADHRVLGRGHAFGPGSVINVPRFGFVRGPMETLLVKIFATALCAQ